MTTRFVQIHTLTHYPASLLNRDDAGFAKRMPFGSSVRTRISSQCLKRHWRTYDGENSLRTVSAPESVRSRVAFERFVVEPLVQEHDIDPTVARLATQKLVDIAFGSEAKKEKAQKAKGKKKDEATPTEEQPAAGQVTTAQVTVLGKPELEYFRQLALEAIQEGQGQPKEITAVIARRMSDKQLKQNIQALLPGSMEAGLGAALFGRMVTGDVLSATDASIHVAHSLTVHGQMAESDYFTAIDDLIREEGEQGSGHINASELTSGLYYGYVVVDVGGLAANLGGDLNLAGDVVHRLVHMVATVSPGAKKGSTAPYAYSHLALVESGKRQPRTLQNSFIRAVRPDGDLVHNTYVAMSEHLAELDAMYGKGEDRAHAGLYTNGEGRGTLFENKMSLPALADWARSKIVES